MLFILIIPILISIYYLKQYANKQFRETIKINDIVGIRFGDYIVDRKIQDINYYEVCVMNLEKDGLIFVPKSRVYARSDESEAV